MLVGIRVVKRGRDVLPAKMVKIVITMGSQHLAGILKFHK